MPRSAHIDKVPASLKHAVGIYVVQPVDPAIKMAKIGKTNSCMESRFKSIQAQSPVELEFVHIFQPPHVERGGRNYEWVDESELIAWARAEQNGHMRSHYEWFHGRFSVSEAKKLMVYCPGSRRRWIQKGRGHRQAWREECKDIYEEHERLPGFAFLDGWLDA